MNRPDYKMCSLLFVLATGLHAMPADTLRVGPGMQFALPSEAARAASDGDVVEILAATYPGDVAVWRQNNLTLRGVHGLARLEAQGNAVEGKGIWVIKGNNILVEQIEFQGATVPDQNGAGIRFEGTNLHVKNCRFMQNENGILTGTNSASHIIIENSEFGDNGYGDGQSHNIYIGEIGKLTVRHSYFHHARIGHNLKSRAQVNDIRYNRIMDEMDGTASYALDFPNGGIAILVGNIIQQGERTDNYHLIAFGAEEMTHSENQLFLINNTLINQRSAGCRFLRINGAAKTARIINNIFYGHGELLQGPAAMKGNLMLRPGRLDFLGLNDPGFVDIARFDFRLTAGSRAVDRGTAPGVYDGISLLPESEYVHPVSGRPRTVTGKIDIGAYEFAAPQAASN